MIDCVNTYSFTPIPYSERKIIFTLVLLFLVLFIASSPSYAATPPDIVNDGSTGLGSARTYWRSNRTWTVPVGVSQIKITSVGAGGAQYADTASGIASGGGGGAVIENVLLNVSSGDELNIFVGTLNYGSGNSQGGASYVSHNGQTYAYAAGGYNGTASGPGEGGSPGGGRGGYIKNKAIVNQASKGKYGTAGQTTIFLIESDSRNYYSAGGGGSWSDGSCVVKHNGEEVWLPSVYNTYLIGSGAGGFVAYHTNLPVGGGRALGGNGAVGISYIISPVSISLSQTSLSLLVGSSQSLQASISPSNADDKSYTWSSSNSKVATVNSSGQITAISNGTTIITAKTNDGGKTATCTVTVTTPTSGVTVTPESATLNVGATKQLTATVAPSTASNKTVTWSTSSSSIASVDSTGLVTAKSAGTATITAKSANGGYTDTCTVTVKAPVTGVSLSSSSLTLKKNESQQLTATVSPSAASNKNVVWSTSDDKVATVTQSGLVTAIGGGTADITVTTVDGSYSAQCGVTVNVPVTGVRFNDTTSSVGTDTTTQLLYTVEPADASDKTVTWQSSNPAVATVDTDTGVITPLAPGGTEITVTTVDGGYSDTTFLMVTSSLEPIQLILVTENGNYPDYGTTYFKSAGNVIEYPGVSVDSTGMLTASIPSTPQDCDLGVSLLNTLIAGTSVNSDTRDIATTLYMIEGDLNNDNVIDGTDYTILIQRMHYDGGLSEYGLVGDLNYDGVVDELDLMFFNSPVIHTGEPRFMQRGYDIRTGDTQTLSLDASPVPVQSIIKTEPTSDGRYEISLRQSTEPVNMMQLSLEGDISETSVAVPEGFDLIGIHTEAGNSVVAIGNAAKGGVPLPADMPVLTVAAASVPRIVYGDNATTMQVAEESGVRTISLDGSKNTLTASPAPVAQSSLGCNIGIGALVLLAAAPLLHRVRHRR